MDKARRRAIAGAFKIVGAAALGSMVWSAAAKAKPNAIWLRPPAALPEKEFVAACIRCGLCVEACPPKILKLADFGDKAPLGTPFFTARSNPCIMCPDVPCVPICPTNALNEDLIKGDDGKMNIDNSKMGIAIIDSEHCIAFEGLRCEVCYRECPVQGAITLDFRQNERTMRHAMFIPVVDHKLCTGCGKCEKRCVTAKAAIFVVPTELAGSFGAHYARGWDEKDQERVEGQGGEAHKKPNSKKTLDRLNSGEF